MIYSMRSSLYDKNILNTFFLFATSFEYINHSFLHVQLVNILVYNYKFYSDILNIKFTRLFYHCK